MNTQIQNQAQRLVLSLVLSLPFLWIACSRKPTSVQELFPDIAFDERSQAKQFAVVASGSDPTIDDLEDGDLNGLKAEGRNWSWKQFDDMTDGTQYLTIHQEEQGPRQGNVLYIKGGGWEKTGAGVSANLIYKTSPRSYGFYDASVYSGIQFWIKTIGLVELEISIGTPETTSIDEGGVCTGNRPGHFTKHVAVSETWTKIHIPFHEFLLTNGKQSLAVDPANLKGIHFAFNTLGDYEIWLDGFQFWKE